MDVNDLFYPENSDDDYWDDKDEVQFVEVQIGHSDESTLIYHNGEWKVKLYAAYRISYDLRISESQAADILQELAGRTNIEEYDWENEDTVYVE